MEYRLAFLLHVQIYPHSTMDDIRSTENRARLGGVPYFQNKDYVVDLLNTWFCHIINHIP